MSATAYEVDRLTADGAREGERVGTESQKSINYPLPFPGLMGASMVEPSVARARV